MRPANNHGERLKQLVAEELPSLTMEEFGRQYLKKSRAATYNLLNKAEFSPAELAHVCFVTGKPPSFFGEPDDYFASPLNAARQVEEVQSIAEFLTAASYYNEDKGEVMFLRRYFATLKDYVNRCRKRLMVYDYFGKTPEGLPKNYETELSGYFAFLEKILAERPAIHYTRILALPLPMAFSKTRPPFEATAKSAILQLFTETFFHLYRCFYDFEDRFSLYILDMPSRLYSFGLIDDSLSVSEYDRYNRFGLATPDTLFIDKTNLKLAGSKKKIDKLFDVYLWEFETLTHETDRSPRRHLNREQFLRFTFELYSDTKSDFEKLKAQKKDLETRLFQTGHSQEQPTAPQEGALQIIQQLAEVKERLDRKELEFQNLERKLHFLGF